MALKALLLRKKIETKKKELEKLNANDLESREEELRAAIEEAETEEEQREVEELADTFEADKAAYEEAKGKLEDEIRELESDLEKEEEAQGTEGTPAPEEREEKKEMAVRNEIFAKMTETRRNEIMAREDVKTWIQNVRTCMMEKRALNNIGLTIPEVFLGLLRENVMEYSKLYKHVSVRAISGEGRLVIMGTIPEAVWTDCCGTLNELDLSFFDTEVACWKVGGYYGVCNAILEDSDIDLAGELLTALGQAIGLALDKAIDFGLGTRMPLGIFTRLAQTEAPSDYPATARPWADLHETNVKTIAASVTGKDLFAQILLAAGAAKGKYSRGGKVWQMNETTYTALMAEAVTIDASGAIVSGVNGVMPVVGGVIEVLDFIPDNVILGGYMDLYLLAERAGAKFAESEHVRFIQDQTVFKGTARYDGKPVIAEGFVAIGIKGTTPSASGVTFAPDTANTTNP